MKGNTKSFSSIATTVTVDHIDATYDALTMMRLSAQLLSAGEIDDKTAGEISWMLGSCGKRIEAVIEVLECLRSEQERAAS